MTRSLDRRCFIKKAAATSAAATLGLSLEEKTLLAAQTEHATGVTPSTNTTGDLQKGRIGNLEISRLICGGNLIGGWAHSRDLMYVSDLLKHYFTDEKILETLEIAERNGINMVNTHPEARDIVNRYRRERGGNMMWLVQGMPGRTDLTTDIQRSIDYGADGVYLQGSISDRFVETGRVELIGQVVEFIKENGLPAGVAAHALDVPIACEEAGIEPDFYVKTLHSSHYWSAKRPDQNRSVVSNPADNYWCIEPEKTIEFMRNIDKPWIAYKVLAAGAIHPRKGFEYAFNNGADFLCVGMFDFQIEEDVEIAKKALSQVERDRPWRG